MSKIANVTTLATMVSYQADAIVSKTLLKQETGSVTLFAFDQGQNLSEHTAPYDALVYVMDGSAEVTISGKTVTVGTGEMVIMPANEPHALNAAEKFKMMLTMIRA